MIWNLYVRRNRGLLVPARLMASDPPPLAKHGWDLDGSFEADDEAEATDLAHVLMEDQDFPVIEVMRDWEQRHDDAVLRAHGPRGTP